MERLAESSQPLPERLATDGPGRDVYTLLKIIEGAQLGTWGWNVATGEVRVNERYAAVLGHTLDELRPLSLQTWSSRVHPEDLAPAEAALKALCEGRSARYEAHTRMRHRDGHWVWILDVGLLVSHTEDGQPEWVLGSHADVTESYLQAQRLRTNERFLERTGRLARVGGWACDVRTGELRLTAEAYRLLGLDATAPMTLDQGLALFTPESRARLRAAIADAVRAGSHWDVEAELQPRSGAVTWLRVNGAPESFDGERRLLIGALQDITDRVSERASLREAQERLRIATESGGIGIWSWDMVTGAVEWNDVNHRVFGSDGEGAVRYEDWESRLHPEDRDRAVAAVAAAVQGMTPFDTEFRILRAGSEVRHIRGTGVVRRDAYGRPTNMVGANWDVTPLRELASRLAEQHELMRVTLRSIGDAVITTCAQGTITWINPEAAAMLGCREEAVRGCDVHAIVRLVNGEGRHALAAASTACLREGKPFDLPEDTLLLLATGAELDVEGSIAPIVGAAGEYLGMVIVLHDVTHQRTLSRELRHLATHDALTGLVNRSAFGERLGELLQRTRESGETHCLLYLDLDEFKQVNDRFGHEVGDRLLQQLAGLLGRGLRGSDTFARLGGDEFALLLEDCSIERASQIASELCERVAGFRLEQGQDDVAVGVSIGLVPMDSRWTDVRALLRAADSACYAAKAAGRNRCQIWPAGSAEGVSGDGTEQRWAPRIERALFEGRFVLFAQRILPADPHAQDALSTAEIVLRIKDDDGRLLGPGDLPPQVQRSAQASAMDRILLERAAEYLSLQSAAGIALRVQISLSGHSLTNTPFRDWLLCWSSELPPTIRARLGLEVPATLLGEAGEALRTLLTGLRQRGWSTVLGGYGGEGPALPGLRGLALDALRLDPALVSALPTDPLARLAVGTAVEAARILGLGMQAPQVQTAGQLAALRELGVSHLQGSHVAPALPLERFPLRSAEPGGPGLGRAG